MPEQGSPDSHARRAGDRPAPDPSAGFATRAIRAAHRQPVVDQRPTSVPIYQTVTFSSGDTEELGAVLTGQRPGYAYGRIDNPTTAAFGWAVAELEGAEDGVALATGMAAIHCGVRVAAVRGRPGRRDIGVLRHDAGPARGRPRRGSASTRRSWTSRTWPPSNGPSPRRRRPSSTPRRSRTRRSSSPTTWLSPTSPIATARAIRRRQHVRLAVSLPADRAGRGPRRRVGDEIHRRPQRRPRRRRRRAA